MSVDYDESEDGTGAVQSDGEGPMDVMDAIDSRETIDTAADAIRDYYHEYARITCGNSDCSYFMKTEKITIGRNSADGTVDIDVGPHTFVSRRHLEMTYAYKRLRLRCLGKNGIFIDNYFRAHSAVPYELPHECTLRFPSTNVEVNVLQLVGRPRTIDDRITNGTGNGSMRITGRKRRATDAAGETLDESLSHMDSRGARDSVLSPTVASPGHTDTLLVMRRPPVRGTITTGNDITGNNRSDSVFLDQIGTNIISDNTNNSRKSSVSVAMSEQSVVHTSSNNSTSKQILQQQLCCIEKTSSSIPQIILNPRSYRSYSYSGDVIYTHNSQVFSSIYDSKDLAIEYGTDTQKPPYSYAQLIVQAVSSSRDRQLTLNGIYNYISKHYPYFKSHDKGWQNSVRHNLSLNRYFIKVPRGQDEPGKGSFWRVDGAYESKLIAQAFRKRRLRSNNCGSISGDNIQSASRLFSLSGGRGSNICTVADRNAKLNNIFTLRRTDQKTPTTFVFRKMGGSQSGTDSVFGPASVINKHDLTKNINMISTENVFHSTKSLSSKPNNSSNNQKRVFQSPISIVNKTAPSSHASSHNCTSGNSAATLITIGGKVFSTNKLKPIQLLSTNSSTSLVPLKPQPQAHQSQQHKNKYILISTSHIDSHTTHSAQSISITGSGTLQSVSTRANSNSDSNVSSDVPVINRVLGGSVASERPSETRMNPIERFDSYQTLSPLSVSETCDFALDEPSQLDSSSTELGPLSPGIPLTNALHPLHPPDEDGLDLEMDQFQFLDSFSMLEYQQGSSIASPADDIEYRDDMDDCCVWQDECLGLQDIEIEIH